MSKKRKSLNTAEPQDTATSPKKREVVRRCEWVSIGGSSEEMERYHDEEWGCPSHCDRHLFEMLTLEGAQAGLSWSTILKKRQGYREAFDNFDIESISRYDSNKVQELLGNEGIVRNRLKINSTIGNARAALLVQKEFGSLDHYFWSFVSNTPVDSGGNYASISDIPTQTPVSEALSKDLKSRGFKFVGPTIIYAFMQAVGMVNDHSKACFKRSTNSRSVGDSS